MFVSQLVSKSLALLVFVIPSLSVFAQQEEVSVNSSLLTNYNALREEGQGFYFRETSVLFLYEKPDSVLAPFVALEWWCDLEFSSEDADTNKYGYVGRGVGYYLGSTVEDAVAQGGQGIQQRNPFSVSAVMVPTLGIFEGQWHKVSDDLVFRYWDDGSSTLQVLAWEGHDEGDTHPNTDTSAWSASGTMTKITKEAAAELLGMDVADMTPATCSMEYKAAWNATHVPDPIDTSVTTLEETVAQLQARIVAIEEGLTSSPSTAWYKYATVDVVMEAIMTVAAVIGLVAIDFI